MVIKNDKQRKAMFAKMNQGTPKAETKPTVLGRITQARQRFQERQLERRETRGRERIKREQESFELEGKRTRRLEAEATLEEARERTTQRTIEAERRIGRVEKVRRERRIAPIRERFQKVRERVQAGVEATRARQPRGRKRVPRQEPREEPTEDSGSPFGIDDPQPRRGRRRGGNGGLGAFGI